MYLQIIVTSRYKNLNWSEVWEGGNTLAINVETVLVSVYHSNTVAIMLASDYHF